jgi:solute carrier family 35 protein F1/2
MVAGATLYGFSEFIFSATETAKLTRAIANATEEFFVRKRPLYEVVGQLGMWGFLICGAQAAGLEHEGMKTVSWNGFTSAS